ncbi:Uncharacterised protein [Mycobacteroides abscessus subsp. massiliense]|nr:Uncharacterised protein [Mycobacteroides abscessus subsp. massiliense]
MGDGYPFRRTRRTRGVNRVRDVVRPGRLQRNPGGLADNALVDYQNGNTRSGQALAQLACGGYGDRCGIGEHELQPRHRYRRIDR